MTPLDKLIDYANSKNLLVVPQPVKSGGVNGGFLDFKFNLLVYDPDDGDAIICVVAHELGHFYDAEQNFGGDYLPYLAEYKSSHDVRYFYEVRAWLYGERILRELGLWSESVETLFRNRQRAALSTYASWSWYCLLTEATLGVSHKEAA